MIKTKITEVKPISISSSSPAYVNRKSGIIYINVPVFKKLSEDQKTFVLLHEAAHVELNTSNEFEADQWAIKNYLKTGRKLSEAVKSLTQNLNENNEEHLNRASDILEELLEYDFNQNKNKMAETYLKRLQFGNFDVEEGQFDENEFLESFINKIRPGIIFKKDDDPRNLLGRLFGANKEAAQARIDANVARANARQDKFTTKSTASNAETQIIEQELKRATAEVPLPEANTGGNKNDEKPFPTMLVVGISIGLVVLLAAVFYFMSKK